MRHFRNNVQPLLLDDDIMSQSLAESSEKAVNVASVPQRSPFRYPGGKTWFVPTIRKWCSAFKSKPQYFVEPFAGGGIISLTVAFENLADKVIMVELDDEVASVWEVVLSDRYEWLINKILNFDLTVENALLELNNPCQSIEQKSFCTLLKNRIYHGGILAKGSGMIKYGENGKGILSRWYPKTIAKRIEAIHYHKDKILFIKGDGLEIIDRYKKINNTLFFIDPPYTAAGKKAGLRLYKHCLLDHEHLFQLMNQVNGHFLMTYDQSDGIVCLAEQNNLRHSPVKMKNTHHCNMNELVISRNLDWL